MSRKATIRRALISVYDKTGVADFARALHDEFGTGILSTGGTARTIEAAGVPVTRVETLTGFEQLLDGRVKTLHPKVFAAILADRDNPDHMRQLADAGIEPIDLVVVGLYPFEKTVARLDCTFGQAVEMIDIGGVALLRAAAKNSRHVWPVCVASPEDYPAVLEDLRGGGDNPPELLRRRRAAKVFLATQQYDGSIADYLAGPNVEQGGSLRRDELASQTAADPVADRIEWPAAGPSLPRPILVLTLERCATARYGENPHQQAALYRRAQDPAPVFTARDAGDGLSYNNVLDADAALRLCAELSHELSDACVCCFIKHANPCGVGVVRVTSDDDPLADRLEAYRRAYLGDPNAALGGILAVNFPVTAGFAAAVMETYSRWGKPLRDAGAKHAPSGFFVEVWIAPDFDDEAVRIIRGERPDGPQKRWGRRVRLIRAGDPLPMPGDDPLEFRSVLGGMLAQTADTVGADESHWRVVSKRPPSEAQRRDLKLAWLVCKHTKSNAITLCRDGMLIGSGAGQTSRVMSCRIAAWQARENGHRDALAGAVAASDAFFPFRDGPDVLIDAGVRAIIQPGGSKRDAETIAACDERDVALVFTGTRHFRH